MGLMDKFKNLFTDEEIIDDEEDDVVDPVEIKEVKKEDAPPKLPTFMREKIEKEEKDNSVPSFDIEKEVKVEDIVDNDDVIGDLKENNKSNFKFPIDDFDDDFIETRSRSSMHKVQDFEEEKTIKPINLEHKKVKTEVKVADLYKDKKEEDEEIIDKKFRATPIISPIYGILDKNYTSSDVEERKGNNLEGRRHSKSVDFDSVRKKAYGSLADDIKENLLCENCEYLKEVKNCKKHRAEEVDDYTEEEDIEDITMDEAAENYYDYGVEYEKKRKTPVVEEDEEVKVVNHLEEDDNPKNEIPPVKSSINLLSTLKKSMGDDEKKEGDLELTDDLFNLIDSMYDERDEK